MSHAIEHKKNAWYTYSSLCKALFVWPGQKSISARPTRFVRESIRSYSVTCGGRYKRAQAVKITAGVLIYIRYVQLHRKTRHCALNPLPPRAPVRSPKSQFQNWSCPVLSYWLAAIEDFNHFLMPFSAPLESSVHLEGPIYNIYSIYDGFSFVYDVKTLIMLGRSGRSIIDVDRGPLTPTRQENINPYQNNYRNSCIL